MTLLTDLYRSSSFRKTPERSRNTSLALSHFHRSMCYPQRAQNSADYRMNRSWNTAAGGIVAFRQELLEIYSKSIRKLRRITKIKCLLLGNKIAISQSSRSNRSTISRNRTRIPRISESVSTIVQCLLIVMIFFRRSFLWITQTTFPTKKVRCKFHRPKQELDEEWRRDLNSNHILEIASIARRSFGLKK